MSLQNTMSPLTEPDIFEKTRWLMTEMLLLAHRHRDTAVIAESQRARGSLEGLRAARRVMDELHDQHVSMLQSFDKALANEDARRKRL